MRTKTYGNVSLMPNNADAGFGPDYSDDPKGNGYLFWQADCFSPAVYLIQASSLEEAYEHAEIVLCPLLRDGDLSDAELAEVWENGSGYGFSMCADGAVRYTEILQGVELRR